MKPSIDLNHEELKSLLSYDKETGHFTALSKRLGRTPVGDNVGYEDGNGYWRIGVCGKYFMAHRLAWLYVYEKWPDKLIDHINGVKNDNRWCNLREATESQNNRNKKVNSKNSLGVKGVSKSKDGKFRVYICLGTYTTVEEAKSVYDEAAKKLHGEFYRA